MKRSALTLVVLVVLVVGSVLLFGNRKTEAPASTVPELSELEKSLANVPLLEPVKPADFGDFKIVTATPDTLIIQHPDGPSKVSSTVDTALYQGVVYKTSDSFFRVLFGKLADKSEGKLELADAYEMVVQPLADGTKNVALRVVEPSTIELDSNKIVRWANLPNDNQIIAALLQFKNQ